MALRRSWPRRPKGRAGAGDRDSCRRRRGFSPRRPPASRMGAIPQIMRVPPLKPVRRLTGRRTATPRDMPQALRQGSGSRRYRPEYPVRGRRDRKSNQGGKVRLCRIRRECLVRPPIGDVGQSSRVSPRFSVCQTKCHLGGPGHHLGPDDTHKRRPSDQIPFAPATSGPVSMPAILSLFPPKRRREMLPLTNHSHRCLYQALASSSIRKANRP